MTSVGQRGKTAEAKVKDKLVAMESHTCTHYRFPDARAGSFTATPCDFMVMHSGQLTVLEVKEVNHAYRLPHKNFDLSQRARMKNWQLAGASAWVLIYFKPEDAWRLIELDSTAIRTGGSWDFSAWPLMSLATAMEHIEHGSVVY